MRFGATRLLLVVATLFALGGEVLTHGFPSVDIGFAVSEIRELLAISVWMFATGLHIVLRAASDN